MSSPVHAKPLKQRQMVARREAEKIRERLQKAENDRLAAIAKANLEAAMDAEAAREELLRDRMDIEKEKKTKPYFVVDKFNRQVPPEQSPVYFGEYKRTKDSWLPHGSGQMLLDDEVHTDGTYVNGLLWGQAKYVERNGSVWEGTFYEGQMHGTGFYTENDFEKYPPPRRRGSEDSDEGSAVLIGRAEALDRGDRIETNGGHFHTIGNRLEALMHRGELVCYLKELEAGVQLQLSDASLCVPLGARATIIKWVKGWKFRVRMQDELNPRERQIDLSTVKKFHVLRELKMAYDLTIFASGRGGGGNIRMDETRSYDYVKDTYQLPIIRQAAVNILSRSRAESSFGASTMEDDASSLDSSGTLSRSSSRFGAKKVLSKEEQLEVEKAARAKIFLQQSQQVGPKLGIAGSRPTGEMRYLHTTSLTADQREKSDYSESMFEARTVGIGRTLDADQDAEAREYKKAQWAAVVTRRREEERIKKQQMVQEQQALALAEASQKNAEKRRQRDEEDALARAAVEAERLEWERKQAEELEKMRRRDEERAQAKLKSR